MPVAVELVAVAVTVAVELVAVEVAVEVMMVAAAGWCLGAGRRAIGPHGGKGGSHRKPALH